LSSPVVFVFSLSSGRFRFSLSFDRVRFLSVFSGYCFLCSVSLCFLCSVSVFDVLLRVQILVLFRVLFLRLCFVFSLFSPVSVSWSIFCFLFMRIAGGGAFVLGSMEVVLMAVTRSVVVAPTFFPAVALFRLTMVVATVVVVVAAARNWVEVSRFWGFDSSLFGCLGSWQLRHQLCCDLDCWGFFLRWFGGCWLGVLFGGG
jgi:hypothetical protein